MFVEPAALVLIMVVGASAADKKEKGRELFEDICSYCHSLHKVDGKQLSKEEWRGLIQGMISEGAPVTDKEFSMIVDYLVKHHGKRSPQGDR